MHYKPALAPRQHQVAARQRMAKPPEPRYGDVFALLMDMGTGKSKVICDEWGERATAHDVSDLLIIAPAGCYSNWIDDHPESPSEFHKHFDPALFDWFIGHKWVSGGSVSSKLKLEQMLRTDDQPRVLVMNAEALAATDNAEKACAAFLESSRHGAIIAVDESPLMKNPAANRTKAIARLGAHRKVAAKRILSGLVTPNSPMDLFSQFEFLDWRILGFRTFQGYRARYAVLRDMKVGVKGEDGKRISERKIKVTVGYRNVNELNLKIKPFSFRVMKDECLDLPPKQYVSRDVELHDEQRRIYTEMKQFATAQLAAEDYVTATMVLTQRLRLSQILVGYTTDEAGKEHAIPELRTQALLDLLGDYQGKAIIWTGHNFVINKLKLRLEKEFGRGCVAQFWGGNRNTRGEEERRFKGDPACRFMLSTQASGGRGNTWVEAGLAVYYDNTDSLDHRAQSEDRNHREGLVGPKGAGKALYVDLLARGTIDERRVKLLRAKIDIASEIQGDDYREWLI